MNNNMAGRRARERQSRLLPRPLVVLKRAKPVALLAGIIAWHPVAWAAEAPELLGVPLEFFLFAATLLGVALFHHHTLRVALIGLAAITLYKLGFTGFKTGPGLAGLADHLLYEWVILTNLLGLLLGFALLSNHFERSRVPAVLPHFLPDDWKGGFVLLAMVFVLSSFLDNIAAAIIGGTMAGVVFRHKVHIGYLAAIVAASNAGGSGSVVGDTTTTMMWIAGVDPLDVFHAYIAAVGAFAVFALPASIQQQRYSPIVKEAKVAGRDWGMLAYAVGFGGSMIWFGSSAGVGLSNLYPESRSVLAWMRHGWHVALAYVVGFFVMLAVLGWQPHEPHKAPAVPTPQNSAIASEATGRG